VDHSLVEPVWARRRENFIRAGVVGSLSKLIRFRSFRIPLRRDRAWTPDIGHQAHAARLNGNMKRTRLPAELRVFHGVVDQPPRPIPATPAPRY